jgi:phospholipase C
MVRPAALGSVFAALALAFALAACTGGARAPTPSRSPAVSTPSATTATPIGGSTPSTRPIASQPLQHVVIIVEENKTATSIIGNSAAPYLNNLAGAYATAYQYAGVSHPSLPNYLAMTSGTTAGITTDCNPPGGSCLVPGPNITQALDRTHRSWKMYAESMATPCSVSNTNLYAVKHNPFLYFPSVTHDPSYCAAHVVGFSRFAADLATTGSLPTYSFISPNLCDDMHDCSIATGDAWLAAVVPSILRSPAFVQQRSLLVVTFDEGDSSDNVVACVFAGPAAALHAKSTTPFNHYSLLRTIEDAWGLPPMTGNDSGAQPMTPLLR